MRKAIETRRVGFTLIELLVVIAIIGLLVSLILVASADGVRRAEERATQALITKLETALNDRLDALLNTTAPINQTHRYLAAINQAAGNGNYVPVASGSIINSIDRRAQVIAQIDYLRAELPDVFFLNAATKDGPTAAASYPLNFAAAPYPSGSTSLAAYALPLGNSSQGLIDNLGTIGTPSFPTPTSGMFGASFSAAGGIYKNLGYNPIGYDGIDNNLNGLPSNGLIDDYLEGIYGLSSSDVTAIQARLNSHTHKTARSEMLYAILVEGLSPLGSVFSRDDFTAREVQDTDGDGLPEFIDAWGEPLQFFRWPIYYGGPQANANGRDLGTSDSQRGSLEYGGYSDARDQNPLDPNQLLMSPAWWSSAANLSLTTPVLSSFATPKLLYSSTAGNGNQCSQAAIGFMNYFHVLVDPSAGLSPPRHWDRGGYFYRRAFFSKFLILSAGPDREPGVAQFNKDYSLLVDPYYFALPSPSGQYIYSFPNSGLSMEQNAQSLLFIENQASVSDPLARTGMFYEINDPGTSLNAAGRYTTATYFLQATTNSDDITNHNISGISTGVR